MSEVPGRRNGFSRPFSKPQIAAWFVLLLTALQFVFFVSPLLPLAASIPITIVFFALIVLIAYYGGLTQAVDPMDVHLRRFLIETQPDVEERLSKFYRRMNPIPTAPASPRDDEPMKQCWLCDTRVAEPSMHCKFCNKCVKNFDHHCMWLNTCIGKDNYNYFFRTMLYIFVMQIMHIIIQIYLVVDIRITGGPALQLARNWFNADATIAIVAVLIFFIIFDGISVFLVGQLLYFHLTLQRENLTTYAYIVRESNKRREKMKAIEEIQSKRAITISRAREDGRSWDVWKLQMGGYCRAVGCVSCDPIEIPTDDGDGNNKEPTSLDDGPASPRAGGFASSFANALSNGNGNENRADVEQAEATTPAVGNGDLSPRRHHQPQQQQMNGSSSSSPAPVLSEATTAAGNASDPARTRGTATSIGAGTVPERNDESTATSDRDDGVDPRSSSADNAAATAGGVTFVPVERSDGTSSKHDASTIDDVPQSFPVQPTDGDGDDTKTTATRTAI